MTAFFFFWTELNCPICVGANLVYAMRTNVFFVRRAKRHCHIACWQGTESIQKTLSKGLGKLADFLVASVSWSDSLTEVKWLSNWRDTGEIWRMWLKEKSLGKHSRGRRTKKYIFKKLKRPVFNSSSKETRTQNKHLKRSLLWTWELTAIECGDEKKKKTAKHERLSISCQSERKKKDLAVAETEGKTTRWKPFKMLISSKRRAG